jgi:cytosine/adenosine deaminase-related metal-dependent hydrolase
VATLRYHYLALQEDRRPTEHLADTFFSYAREVRSRFFPGTGAFDVGGAADIAVLEYVPHTPIARANALMHLIFGARNARAFLTMIDGRIVFEDGTFRTIDADAVRGEITRAASRLHERFYG